MNKLALFGINLLVFFFFMASAEGRTGATKLTAKRHTVTKKALPGDKNGQLGTDFSFEAASIHGKYQMAGQGVATVEDEKVLDDLLGLRLQFKDREQQEASRR
jgi:hypothetical protein